MFYRKYTPKAAAFFSMGELDDFNTMDMRQECSWLLIDSKPAQQMAGRVISYFARPVRADVGDAHLID
jgi:hypothetical protein